MNSFKVLKLNIILFLSSMLVCFSFLCYINSYSAAECVSNATIEHNYQFIQIYIEKINNSLLIPHQVPPLILSHSEMMQLAQNATSIEYLVEVLQNRVNDHFIEYEKTWKLYPIIDNIICYASPSVGLFIFYIVLLSLFDLDR